MCFSLESPAIKFQQIIFFSKLSEWVFLKLCRVRWYQSGDITPIKMANLDGGGNNGDSLDGNKELEPLTLGMKCYND